MKYSKIYVTTVVEFTPNGQIIPRHIVWSDGRKYSVDKIYSVKYAPANVGAEIPERYDCDFSGRRRFLYYEDSLKKWFVEKPDL